MKLHWLLALALCLLSTEVRLSACDCIGQQPTCQAAGEASAVFVGEVLEIRDNDLPARNAPRVPFYARRVSLKVSEVFRGEVPDTAEVHTGAGGGDCGYAFKKGQSYLIYAHLFGPDARLTTGICSRTKPGAQARSELDELRKRCVK